MKHMVSKLVCLATVAGMVFGTSSAQAGVWVRVTFRQSGAQFQISEFGLYDANGVRINTGLTNKGAGTDPATLAAKQYTAEPAGVSGEYWSCLDNNLNSKWYNGQAISASDSSTWKSLVMRLADDARPCGYLMATANDCLYRSPTCWTVQASADGTNWTDVDVKDNEPYPGKEFTWWRGGEPYPFRYPWISYYAERVLTNVPYSATSDLKCGMLVTDSHTGEVLTEGEDYSLSYAGNTGIGAATVTVTGLRGAYEGVTDVRNYQIVPAFKATLLRDRVPHRGGEECACDVVVSNFAGTAELVEGRDYTLTYENNRNVGTASVTVTGINDYEGNLDTQTFTITPLGVWTRVTFMQNGNPNEMIQLGELKVCTEEGDILTTGMSACDNVLVPDLPQKGFALFGQGLLPSGAVALFDTVLGGSKWCKGVSGLTVVNGPSKWIELTMRLADGARPLAYNFATGNDAWARSPTHWTFSVSTNGYDWIEVDRREDVAYPTTASTWWNGGEPFRFEYPWIPFQTAVVQTNMFYHAGAEHKCGVVVRDYWTKETLTENTHYTVRYENNTGIGTATVIVSGIGSYSGVSTKNFEIIPGFAVELATSEVVTLLNEPCTVGITVCDTETEAPLNEGEDYRIEYVNNDRYGIATVRVIGIGGYSGNVAEKTFEIVSGYVKMPALYAVNKVSDPCVPSDLSRGTAVNMLHDGKFEFVNDFTTSDAMMLDFGMPHHIGTVAVAPRTGCPQGIRDFVAEASNDLDTWTVVHTNYWTPPDNMLTQYKLNSYDGKAYRYLRVRKQSGTFWISELAAHSLDLMVEATDDAQPFESTAADAADAADGVAIAGKLTNSTNGPAIVQAFFARTDHAGDIAAWRREGAMLDFGSVAPGASFSGRMVGLGKGRWYWRLVAICGTEVSLCQPMTSFVVGSKIAYPRAYVPDSRVACWYDANVDNWADIGSTQWIVFDLKDAIEPGRTIDGIRCWWRSGYPNRFNSSYCDFGYDTTPEGADWSAAELASEVGNRKVYTIPVVPAGITWTNDADNFLADSMKLGDYAYHPWKIFHEKDLPRYIRIRNPVSGNINEIEFRTRRLSGLLITVR